MMLRGLIFAVHIVDIYLKIVEQMTKPLQASRLLWRVTTFPVCTRAAGTGLMLWCL